MAHLRLHLDRFSKCPRGAGDVRTAWPTLLTWMLSAAAPRKHCAAQHSAADASADGFVRPHGVAGAAIDARLAALTKRDSTANKARNEDAMTQGGNCGLHGNID